MLIYFFLGELFLLCFARMALQCAVELWCTWQYTLPSAAVSLQRLPSAVLHLQRAICM